MSDYLEGETMPAEDHLKFCGSCGASLEESARFCGGCGTPISEVRTDDEIITEEENSEPIYPYSLYPEVEIESDEYVPVAATRRRNGFLWATGLVVVIVGGIILANANNSENAAFLAGATSNTDTSANTTSTEPSPSPSSTPSATKSSTSPSPKASSKPSPKKVNQCAINNQTTSDIVEFKNLIQIVPSGRNDASHKGSILQWVDSTNSNSEAIRGDAAESSGGIVSAMIKSANDLATLAGLAQDWANNNLSDPASFPTQYGNAASAVRADYAKMSSICGSALP